MASLAGDPREPGRPGARKRELGAVLAVCLLAIAPGAPAARASAEAQREGSLRSHLSRSDRLLGTLGGRRTRWSEVGVALQAFLNYFGGWKAHGGRDPGDATDHSGTLDLFAHADLQALGIRPEARFLLHLKSGFGENVNPDVGALSEPFDDADFDEPLYVSELWLEQGWRGGLVSLRLGYLEQQTAFDRNAFANSEDKQFFNSFLDNNPLVPLKTGLGATLFLRPKPWLSLAFGTADADNPPRQSGFDTAFDGLDSLMAYGELTLALRLPSRRGALPGSLRLGFVRDGTRRVVFERAPEGPARPDRQRGHWGAYLSLDQLVFREGTGDRQGLGVFLRFGTADEDVSPVARFWSAGLQYEGLLPSREADVLGFGFYRTHPSGRYRDAVDPSFGRETGFELYYRLQATPWLTVTPDLQVLRDPGATGEADDAVVVLGLRLRVTL